MRFNRNRFRPWLRRSTNVTCYTFLCHNFTFLVSAKLHKTVSVERVGFAVDDLSIRNLDQALTPDSSPADTAWIDFTNMCHMTPSIKVGLSTSRGLDQGLDMVQYPHGFPPIWSRNGQTVKPKPGGCIRAFPAAFSSKDKIAAPGGPRTG